MLNQDRILQGAIAASQGQSPDSNPFQINRGSTDKAGWELGWLVQKLSDDHDETLLYRYSAPAGAD